MNFKNGVYSQKQSMCYFYTRKFKNKHMAGGARCAQPGLFPLATGFYRANFHNLGGPRTTNKLFLY